MMRIEVGRPFDARRMRELGAWEAASAEVVAATRVAMQGWHRVVDEAGSTIAYVPDRATAEAFIHAVEIREYLVESCRVTCTGREVYRGRLRHMANCPAYNLDLIDDKEEDEQQ